MNELAQVGSGALAPSDYATFEVAKANDGILGGSDIAQIRSYAAYARAQAQAIHKTIAATSGIDDVATIKAEATETAQTFAKVGIYADQRIGELLRELPTRQGKRTDTTSCTPMQEVTKAKAIEESGISSRQAYDLQTLAANPDVVEAVITKAEEEGRIPSRAQVLKAIKERDDALAEVEELERQNDKLYAQVHDQSEPQVFVREVVPRDYESIKADYRRQVDDYQKLHEKWIKTTSELEKANAALGAEKEQRYARRDLQNLISAINEMIRRYGGNVWAFSEWRNLHESTQRDLKTAVMSLNGFAQQLLANINELDQNGLENG